MAKKKKLVQLPALPPPAKPNNREHTPPTAWVNFQFMKMLKIVAIITLITN